MRDFLDAVASRVVVYDGGMGATLEQLELTQRGLRRAGRPLPRSARAATARTSSRGSTARCSTPAPRSSRRAPSRRRGSSSASGVSPTRRSRSTRGPHSSRAKPPARSGSSPGSIGPTGYLPASEEPDARPDQLPRARRGVRRAGAGPRRGRRGPADHRNRAGHPRGQGGGLRRARGVQAAPDGRCRSTPRSRCCPTAARCCSAPTSRRC